MIQAVIWKDLMFYPAKVTKVEIEKITLFLSSRFIIETKYNYILYIGKIISRTLICFTSLKCDRQFIILCRHHVTMTTVIISAYVHHMQVANFMMPR